MTGTGAGASGDGLQRGRITVAAAWVMLAGLCALLALWVPWQVSAAVLLASLAVAVVLRGRIADAVNGLWLRREAVLAVGHYIRVEGREDVEGSVVHIGWRDTVLQTPGGDLARLPNTTLANSIFTNFHLAHEPETILVDLDADAAVAARRVRRLIDVEADAMSKTDPGIVAGSQVVRALPGRFTSSRRYVLSCRARDHGQRDTLRRDLERRLHDRLRREQIPVLTLSTDPEDP